MPDEPIILSWRDYFLKKVESPNHNAPREPRVGVMLHYDGSATDEGAVQWFEDPRCAVSYHYLVLDDGQYVEIAPHYRRAWHAGTCVPSGPLKYGDANSAFYGIAAATNRHTPVTAAQTMTIVWLTRRLFEWEGWPIDETHRIVGHDTEAWPRGRKIDPTGPDPDDPILSVDTVRRLLKYVEI